MCFSVCQSHFLQISEKHVLDVKYLSEASLPCLMTDLFTENFEMRRIGSFLGVIIWER